MSRPAPSLAARALAAVVLTVAFYALALVIGIGLMAFPIVHFARGGSGNIFVAGALVVAGFTVLKAIVPVRGGFEAPGPQLDPVGQPELHAELRGVAEALGEQVPAEVYLDAEVNAAVLEVGRPRRRVMILGLPLLAALRPEELRAVVAHEYGHYMGGDTRFSGWIWRTRVAVLRTVAALEKGDSWFRGVVVRAPFLAYAKLFLRLTNAISRRQEFAADAVAVRVAGAPAAAAMLRRVTAVAPAYDGYWREDVAFVLRAERRPPLAAGFQRFLADHRVRASLDEVVSADLQVAEADPYDSHPTLAERLRALGEQETGETSPPPAQESALVLLRDVPALEGRLLHAAFGDRVFAFAAIAWADAGVLRAEEAGEVVASCGSAFAGRSVADAADLVADPAPVRAALVASLGADAADAGTEELDGYARFALGAHVVAALHRAGWTLHAWPGDPISARRGDAVLEPYAEIADDPQAWRARCAALAIDDLPLVQRTAVAVA